MNMLRFVLGHVLGWLGIWLVYAGVTLAKVANHLLTQQEQSL